MNKVVVTALAGTLALGSLAGCGGADKKQEAAAPGGKLKFSMLISTSGNKYAEKSPDINQDKWVKKLEEKTNSNIDLRMIPLKDFDAKMAVMFAGNDIPDVVQNVGGATSKGMSGSVEAGVFMPLDDLLKQYAPNLMKAVPKEAWDETTYQGKIYGIPNWLSNTSRRATFIRTDLLEKTGLPQPKTVEEFLNMLLAFKKLGIDNTYQLRENFKYADTFLGAYDVLPAQFEVQGDQIVPKFFDVENMTKALQVYKTMYDEGLVPKDFATISSTDYSKNIESGKAGSWSANAEGLINFRGKLKDVMPSAKVDVIPSPRGPENKGGHLLYSSIVNSYYINKNVSKDKAIQIVKFFDSMLSPEMEKFFSFGIEGENYTVENGSINYKRPTNQDGIDEEGFRSNLWFVHDVVYNKLRSEQTQDGRDMIKNFDTILSKEGLGSVRFVPALPSFAKYPDLAPQADDVGPKLIIDHMVKMIYGKEPISDWPKVIEEYKSKGGNEILKEANERYKKKDGVIIQQSRQ
ncbi:extracellular solute-binding protein [Paenibacillus filicis]|uniref:Extracellular solute-binding protein n=1 Tax=Paenibacillus gyeongsangnamensis TaxID=3388067 RepID=A0ABT4QAZ5_9BACL|nr:extracellular solute-binding protein [Paenibacillus filicis]MCZ8514046.1 extracellular solute-binding protein [Paenibacillus filicis]